jgi:hypothetical protein
MDCLSGTGSFQETLPAIQYLALFLLVKRVVSTGCVFDFAKIVIGKFAPTKNGKVESTKNGKIQPSIHLHART